MINPKTKVQGKNIPGNLKKYFISFNGLTNIERGGLIAIVPKGFQFPLLSLVPKSSSFNIFLLIITFYFSKIFKNLSNSF